MDVLMTLAISIVSFLVVLSVVVFVHEYGHFIVARLCGVKVEAFSMGFGPELAARVDDKGTRWRIAAIPLGGYVKFYGDDNGASMPSAERLAAMSPQERALSFFGQPVWKRAAVVFAGPFFNFLLAIALFFVMFTLVGRPALVDGQPVVRARISAVTPEGAGAKAGFQAGDLVLSVDGAPIETFSAFQKIVSASADKTLHIIVSRADGEQATLDATPALTGEGASKVGRLGLRSSEDLRDWKMEPCGVFEAAAFAVEETWSVVTQSAHSIAGIFTGRVGMDQVSGVIGIAADSGKIAQKIPTNGLWPFINWIALLSCVIGFMNLLPIPLLDGGHLVFFSLEALRGRALDERTQEYAFRVGLALVGSLMLLATYNDIASRFRHLFSAGL